MEASSSSTEYALAPKEKDENNIAVKITAVIILRSIVLTSL
jgi:hypothetical protein